LPALVSSCSKQFSEEAADEVVDLAQIDLFRQVAATSHSRRVGGIMACFTGKPAESTSNEGVRLTSREALKNPPHAQ
jgi:hypothetical protein